MKQPYIILTVNRRYSFLAQNLRHIASIKDAFQIPPKIVVVRGDPEPGCDSLFSQWEYDGLLNIVVDRPKIDKGRGPQNITLWESLNINYGHSAVCLDRVINNADDNYYTIVQASDCYARPEAYTYLDLLFSDADVTANFFKWGHESGANGVHTNFFVYNPPFVPPLSKNNRDVLEVQYYYDLPKQYRDSKIYLNDNDNLFFVHTHDLYDSRLNFLKDEARYVEGS